MVALQQTSRSGVTPAILHGALGGAVAGMAMAMAEMMWSAATGMGVWMSLQMIASVPLGKMPPDIALSTALPVGMATHMVLSMMFGWGFVALLAVVRPLRSSTAVIVVAATAFGFTLWIVNFYAIAPALGRDWFTDAGVLQQLVAHTFAFGSVLGIYVARTLGAHDSTR